MKTTQLKLFVLSFCLLAPALSFADGTAVQVFDANQGKVLTGRNTVSHPTKDCSAFFDNGTLYYNFKEVMKITAGTNPAALGNSISAGHFHKRMFQSQLVYSFGSSWDPGCIIGGRCTEGKLTIQYDSKNHVTAIRDEVNGSIQNTCQF